MSPNANASLVLHTVSAETATGRASRLAAEDVLRLVAEVDRYREALDLIVR